MPASKPASVKPLLLAGGPSTRVGFPKHLLRMPDGRPVYQHQLDRLHRACPEADALYVSVGRGSVLDGFLRDVARPFFARRRPAAGPGPIALLYDDEDQGDGSGSGWGPAAGLLAAHDADPGATWLVLACDYPLLTADVLARVRAAHEPPLTLTCLRGLRGEPEPLVGMWGPEALRELAARVRGGGGGGGDGSDGLRSVVEECGALVLDAPEPRTRMLSVKTDADWDDAFRLASEASSIVKKERIVNGPSQGSRPLVV